MKLTRTVEDLQSEMNMMMNNIEKTQRKNDENTERLNQTISEIAKAVRRMEEEKYKQSEGRRSEVGGKVRRAGKQ